MRFFICVLTIVLAMTSFAASQANGNKSEIAPVFVDFSKCANMGFADEAAGDGRGGWSDQGPGNDFREFDVKAAEFGGVPFKIIDPAANDGKAVMSFRYEQVFPGLNTVTAKLPDKSSGRYLYLLHTACYNGLKFGESAGTVTVTTSDGKQHIIDIKSKREVADWANPVGLANGFVAVSKPNQSAMVGVYLSRFDLGSKLDIQSLTLTTTGKNLWIVLAATITNRDIPLPEMRKLTISAGKEWKALPDTGLAVKQGTALDFSSRLDHAPAGSRGRVIARTDGTLAFASEPDKPVRFFVHSGFAQGPHSPDLPLNQVDAYADAIMRQGYNMVRFSFLDQYLANQVEYWGKTITPEAQLEFDRRLEAGEQIFKPEHLEYIDRLVAALKKRGIYIYLDAMSSWTMYYPANCWYPKNGVKGTNLFVNPAARRHYHNAVKQLLTHINPYTKTSFATDPQVAIILGNNETGTGLGSNSNPVGSLYLPVWRTFLRSRFADVNAYHAAWHSQGPKAASIDEAPFFTQKDFWDTARGIIIEEFINKIEEETAGWQENEFRLSGYQGLFTQYDWLNQLRLYLARAKVGVVSMHGYFAHPGDAGGKQTVVQDSAVAQDLNWWRGIASVRIAGIPLAVMEYGQVFWNRYRYEEGLSVGAYGSFQDMSVLTAHAAAVEPVKKPAAPFTVGIDPVGRASQVVTGILFMDKTVKTAPHRVDIPLSRELALSRGERAISGDQSRIGLVTGLATQVEKRESSVPASLRLPLGDGAKTVDSQFWSSVIDSESGTFSGALAQLRKAGIIPADNRTNAEKKIYESETKEILLDANNKRLTVNTPLAVGTCGDKWDVPVTIGPLSIESSSVPASITLASRDGQKLGKSGRMLLVIATDAHNSGASYDDAEGIVQNNAGKLPVLLRTGSFALRIARDPQAPVLHAWALALDGSRREELQVQSRVDGVRLDIDTGAWNKGPSPFIELSEK